MKMIFYIIVFFFFLSNLFSQESEIDQRVSIGGGTTYFPSMIFIGNNDWKINDYGYELFLSKKILKHQFKSGVIFSYEEYPDTEMGFISPFINYGYVVINFKNNHLFSIGIDAQYRYQFRSDSQSDTFGEINIGPDIEYELFLIDDKFSMSTMIGMTYSLMNKDYRISRLLGINIKYYLK